MERIAPLAKILAEANGIDWQQLHGSGEGGLIVDQDVVDYLMRVMSGEAEPPATPVDAPPPEWTGTELPAGGGLLAPGMPSMDMLSSAGVDSDLAALVGQPQMAAPAAVPSFQVTVPQEPEPQDTSLEEDGLEFELEDDAEIAPQVAALPPAAAADVQDVEIVPALPELQPEPQAAESGDMLGVAASPAIPSPAEVAAPAASGGMMAGLGNLLSRLYQPAQSPAPTLAAQPVTPPPAAQASPAPFVPPVVAESAPTPRMDPPRVEAPVIEMPEVQVAEVQAPEVELADVAAKVDVQEAPVPAAQVADVQAEPVIPEPDMPVPAPVLSAPPQGQPHNAVWFGTYLRREANVAPAAELRRQLTGALGQDVPLALLVARAARHHADSLGLSGVAVQDLDAGRARTVQPGHLRGALAALDTDYDGTPDLLVIDAGALDLDGLHLPHTLTLSVGRVQEGRAALTLNGDVDPARAARFLAGVAATLEEPIILVL